MPPVFIAPSIRPSRHHSCTRRSDRLHFAEKSFTEIYFTKPTPLPYRILFVFPPEVKREKPKTRKRKGGAAGVTRSPEVTHKIMSAVRSKETRPEVALRHELWRRGLRYRKNDSRLPGKPDIVLSQARLAIFCDGDFWHGHNWAIRGYGSLEKELKRYSETWANKILRNIQRDKDVNQKLEYLGWQVLRIWESDIKKDVKKSEAKRS